MVHPSVSYKPLLFSKTLKSNYKIKKDTDQNETQNPTIIEIF